MMTVEIILNELDFNIKELSPFEVKCVELFVNLYNNHAQQRSTCMTEKEILIENVKGCLLGYSPIIKGLYYEDWLEISCTFKN